MFKRIVFLSLSVITFVIIFTIFTVLPEINLYNNIGIGILIYFIILIAGLITSIFYSERYNRDIGTLAIILPYGFISLKFKRIYYSDLGYFWARLYKNRVYVYNQKLFILDRIFDVYYNDDHEAMSFEIKHRLQEIFKDEMIKSDKTKKFKSWNGFVDKISQREGKINSII